MANENQNIGPNTQGGDQQSKKSILDAKAALRELIDDQGDYNNLLKMSLKDLDNMQKAYTRISAKIDSLNKGAINVRQVQQELARLNQKEFTAKQKVLDLQEGLSEYSRGLLKEQTKLNSLLTKAQTESQKNLVNRKLQENAAKREANVELQNLEYAKVASKIAKEEVDTGIAILETEKKVSKQMGISGNLAKILADKLGVGEEAYEAMSFQARKLVKDQGDQVSNVGKWKVAAKGIGAASKALISNILDPAVILGGAGAVFSLAQKGLDGIGNAAAKAGNFIAGLSEDSSNIIRGMTSGFSDLARKIPLVGGLIGGLIDGLSAVLDLVIGVDDKIVKAGRQLNMTAGQARSFNRSLQDSAFNSNNILINSKKLLESQVDLTNQLGVVNTFNKEILETNIMLKDVAGLEADVRQRIVEIATVTENSAEGTTKSILAQVEGLKKATGIEFQSQKILKDIASQTGVIGLQFTKYPAQLTKSLLTVKAMGLELKDLDSMASSFLDFESSISKEFEAQLLTGKNINLAKAREAFLNNDLVTAASEINNQIGSSEEFLKLNRIQAESLAEAFGMNRDQLGEMLRQQEILAKVGGKQGDTAKEQLRLGLEKYKNEKALAEAIGDQNYQALINASTQEKIAGFIDRIKQSIVDFIERTDIISKIEKFVKMLENPDTIKGILGKIRDTISTFIEVAGELLGDILEVGGHIADFFTPFGDTDYSEKAAIGAAKVRSVSSEMAKNVRSLGTGGGVSVEDNAAKDKVKSEKAGAAEKTDDMSMRSKSSEPKVYNIIILDPITGKSIEKQVTEAVYFDMVSGKQ